MPTETPQNQLPQKKKFAMDLYFFSPHLMWKECFPSATSLTERDFTADLFDMMSATQAREQPHSQGLSSYRPLGAPGGSKMRDPGNEVG